MMDWLEDFEKIVDKSPEAEYSKIRELKKNKFRGYIKINFDGGLVGNVNVYSTLYK